MPLSQTFKDLPDLKPIKVKVYYSDAIDAEKGLKGVLISPYIGVKVFLNSISGIYGYAPTKVRLYNIERDMNNDLHIDEIQTKGACNKRLIDFGVIEDSKLFIWQT